MTGNYGDNHPLLISPAEAVAIAIDNVTMVSASRARDIIKEWIRRTSDRSSAENWPGWMYAAIYEAGRIQGIREERQKKKGDR